MPFLQTSGTISIQNVKDIFGGPASPSLANYYRGGSYIPATKSAIIREPSSGDFYSGTAYWYTSSTGGAYVIWNGVVIHSTSNTNITTYTSGSTTYYRSTYRGSQIIITNEYSGTSYIAYYYGVYRTLPGLVNINLGIPSSSTISISQFYGAEKP